MFRRALLLSAIALPLFAVASHPEQQQLPFIPPSSSPSSSSDNILTSPQPTLNDLLTINRQASIFFDYIRDSSSSISTLLIAPSPSYTTLLVPVNSAIIALSRKPHQGPPPLDGMGKVTIKGSREEEEELAKYLERWVAGHVVRAEVKLGEKEEMEWDTLEGRKVTFSLDVKGNTIVTPGNVKTVGEYEASNGKIIVLENVLPLEK